MSKTSKNKALVVLNAHHLRRQLDDLPVPINPRELNATLVIWLAGWLDELSDDLTGQQGYSATHLAAMKRCLAAIESCTAIKFDQYIYTSEGLNMNEILKTKVDAPKSKAKPVKAATIPPVARASQVVAAVVTKKPVPPITKDTGRVPKRVQKKQAATKASPADASYRIKVLVEGNPKRDKKSGAYRFFEMYRKYKTVGEYLAKGGSRAYLKYDAKQGYVKIVKA